MPDDKVIQLERTFGRMFVRFETELAALDRNLDTDTHHDDTQNLLAPLETLIIRIAGMRATTIEGLAAKARVATKFGGAIDNKISDSIIADLLEIPACTERPAHRARVESRTDQALSTN